MFSKKLQVPTIDGCNSNKITSLRYSSRKNKVKFDNSLYDAVIGLNNLGGIKVNFSNGAKLVYRSAYLATAPFCISALANKINLVINLYAMNSGYAKNLHPLEKQIFNDNGVNNYLKFKNFEFYTTHNIENLNKQITDIINLIKNAKGNVLIHCYAGEHDTGVIFAILNKCINNAPYNLIEENLACHMNTTSTYGKKALKRIKYILKQYPCRLLTLRKNRYPSGT